MRALADKHDTGAVPLVAAVLKGGKTDEDRARAADALWILGDPAAVPDLLAALRDRSTLVAGYAASGLGDLADASVVPPLLDFFGRLPDNRDEAKARAADALGKLGDAKAIGPLAASVEAIKAPAYLQWAQPALQNLRAGTPRLPPHPLAGVTGRYYWGDGLYAIVNLSLDRERYSSSNATDVIGSERRTAGRVTGDGKRLMLTPDGLTGSAKWEVLTVIRWGRRVYLVHDDRVKRFCEDVARGVEPRSSMRGTWFLRVGDEEKPVPKGSAPDACGVSRR
jgi:hypothetical protein